jgi:hypothetical protein
MVIAVWFVTVMLGAVLFGVSVYLVSVGSGARGMRDPATAPVWALLLAGARGVAAREEAAGDLGVDDRHRTAA